MRSVLSISQKYGILICDQSVRESSGREVWKSNSHSEGHPYKPPKESTILKWTLTFLIYVLESSNNNAGDGSILKRKTKEPIGICLNYKLKVIWPFPYWIIELIGYLQNSPNSKIFTKRQQYFPFCVCTCMHTIYSTDNLLCLLYARH